MTYDNNSLRQGSNEGGDRWGEKVLSTTGNDKVCQRRLSHRGDLALLEILTFIDDDGLLDVVRIESCDSSLCIPGWSSVDRPDDGIGALKFDGSGQFW